MAFGIDYLPITALIGLPVLFSLGVPLGRRLMVQLFANPVAGDVAAFVPSPTQSWFRFPG